MSCLLLAAAALCWPVGIGRWPVDTRGDPTFRRLGAAGTAVLGAGVPASGHTGGRLIAGRARVGDGSLSPPVRLLAVASGCCVASAGLLLAGPAGLIATALALGTGGLLLRRELADRRHRMALVDMLAALRILGRELQAGAEPGLAAANAATAARGEGAQVLAALAHLTRTDDRTVVGGLAHHTHGGSTALGLRAQVIARLRGGWLLTRWHGLAFTPLVAALALDLSEQLAAGSERAGQVAGPRTSGYVMALLPLLGLALGAGMGADPVRVLTGSVVGNVLLLVGVGLTCAGLLWSARIVAT